MLVELAADVDWGSLDGLEEHLRNTGLLDIYEVWLEHAFGCFKAL